MIEIQKLFMENLEFQTEWGKNKFNKLIQPRIVEIGEMIDVI